MRSRTRRLQVSRKDREHPKERGEGADARLQREQREGERIDEVASDRVVRLGREGAAKSRTRRTSDTKPDETRKVEQRRDAETRRRWENPEERLPRGVADDPKMQTRP